MGVAVNGSQQERLGEIEKSLEASREQLKAIKVSPATSQGLERLTDQEIGIVFAIMSNQKSKDTATSPSPSSEEEALQHAYETYLKMKDESERSASKTPTGLRTPSWMKVTPTPQNNTSLSSGDSAPSSDLPKKEDQERRVTRGAQKEHKSPKM